MLDDELEMGMPPVISPPVLSLNPVREGCESSVCGLRLPRVAVVLVSSNVSGGGDELETSPNRLMSFKFPAVSAVGFSSDFTLGDEVEGEES
jgi:hypothetical protein